MAHTYLHWFCFAKVARYCRFNKIRLFSFLFSALYWYSLVNIFSANRVNCSHGKQLLCKILDIYFARITKWLHIVLFFYLSEQSGLLESYCNFLYSIIWKGTHGLKIPHRPFCYIFVGAAAPEHLSSPKEYVPSEYSSVYLREWEKKVKLFVWNIHWTINVNYPTL